MTYKKHLNNLLENTLAARQAEKAGRLEMAASYYANANNFKRSRELLQKVEIQGNNLPWNFAYDII